MRRTSEPTMRSNHLLDEVIGPPPASLTRGKRGRKPREYSGEAERCQKPWLPQAETRRCRQGADREDGMEIGLHADGGPADRTQDRQADPQQQDCTERTCLEPGLQVDIVAVEAGRDLVAHAGNEWRVGVVWIVEHARRGDADA